MKHRPEPQGPGGSSVFLKAAQGGISGDVSLSVHPHLYPYGLFLSFISSSLSLPSFLLNKFLLTSFVIPFLDPYTYFLLL